MICVHPNNKNTISRVTRQVIADALGPDACVGDTHDKVVLVLCSRGYTAKEAKVAWRYVTRTGFLIDNGVIRFY